MRNAIKTTGNITLQYTRNKQKIHSALLLRLFPAASFIQKLMFHRVENWCFSSYLQIRFIESILNTAGASKSPIYCKHLISSGSERLGFERRVPGACLWLHSSDSSMACNTSALSMDYSDTFRLLSSRCHLLSRYCTEDANCVWLQDWVVSTDPDEVKKKRLWWWKLDLSDMHYVSRIIT